MKMWVACFGDKPVRIEHERIIRAGIVRFDLGQDRVQQIGVMNSRIENLRRRPAKPARDQSQPGPGVTGGLCSASTISVGPD
jgi:hypothetical protein